MDWISALRGFTQSQISAACAEWLRSEKWRPTPRDILGLIEGQRKAGGGGNLANLSPKEAATVQAIIARAKRHVSEFPAGSPLHEHAMQTLRHWGQA